MKKDKLLTLALRIIVTILSATVFTVWAHAAYTKSTAPSQRTSLIKVINGRLLINNQPYLVKSTCYEPVEIGIYYNGMDWGDESIYERDFPKILDMGFNTIRAYHNSSSKALYKQAAMHGLWVCPTFLIDGTIDFSDEQERQAIKDRFISFITTYKNEPALLFWIIGNEQNYTNGNCPDWYSLANELAILARQIEGAQFHPCAISEGDLGNIGDPALGADDNSLTHIDIWACNIYRGESFYDFFNQFTLKTSKALFISEYGNDSWNSVNTYYPENGYEDEEMQKNIDLGLWREIESFGVPVIGGSVFSYSDDWWKDFQGKENIQEYGGIKGNGVVDGFFNEEWWGLMKRADGSQLNQMIEKEAVSGYRDELKIYVGYNPTSILQGNGTKQNPYSSIQKAISIAQPGDTIQIMPGAYKLQKPLTINKSITILGNINNSGSVAVTYSGNDYAIKIGNNSHVNLIGITIEANKSIYIGGDTLTPSLPKKDYSKVVIRNCYIKCKPISYYIIQPAITCNSYTEARIINNKFSQYFSYQLLARENSIVWHKGNNIFRYLRKENAVVKEIPPCPSLSASSDTIIHRNGNYENINLNISWNGLEGKKTYYLFYIIINLPQGYSSAHKNGSLWQGETIPITTPQGSIQIMENLSIHSWNDLLWVFEIKDENGQSLRVSSFSPNTILNASIDKILRRNNTNININFQCEWDNLVAGAEHTIFYVLKNSSQNNFAAYDNDNGGIIWEGATVTGIQGPSGNHSAIHNLGIFLQEELKWITQLKDQDGNLIDESCFIPRTILSQNTPESIPTGVQKNYFMVYSITAKDGGDYLLIPDSEYKLKYVLIEADTGNYWACSWDNEQGCEWHGDTVTKEGIDLFNPLTIKKDLTVYDYNKFLWVVELYENEELIDKTSASATKH